MKNGLALATGACLLLGACSVVEPEPLNESEIVMAAVDDRWLIAASEEPIAGPVDLAEATARALKFNLEHRVQVMEEALAAESFELAKYDMLPVLAAEAGANFRDSYNASSSESYETRQESLEPSYSEDRAQYTASGRFSFSLLDFGVSYLQAKQEANRFLVAQLAREKSMQRLANQVRTAYWRAAALQRVSPEIERLLREAGAARADLESVHAQRLRPPVETLEEIRALTETIQQLETMQQSVSSAMIDLAGLINITPGTDIPLVIPAQLDPMPRFDETPEELELLALANNTDYTAQLYNVRVDRDEARKSILRLLPGVELFAGSLYDSNSFLVFNQWNEAGARVTWNIMRLLATPQIMDQNEAREVVTQARRLAANMGAITQLYLAWQQYRSALDRLERAADIDDLDRQIEALAANATNNGAMAESTRLRNQVRALRSSVARMLAYASAQESYGNLLSAMGLNPVPLDYQSRPVSELATDIRESYAAWAAGQFPTIAMPDYMPDTPPEGTRTTENAPTPIAPEATPAHAAPAPAVPAQAAPTHAGPGQPRPAAAPVLLPADAPQTSQAQTSQAQMSQAQTSQAGKLPLSQADFSTAPIAEPILGSPLFAMALRDPG
jgi:outer membrane protein TolC